MACDCKTKHLLQTGPLNTQFTVQWETEESQHKGVQK